MGGYYLLSGQAFKAAGEAAKWIDEKVNQSLYHTAKGIYAMANNDSEKAN